MSKYDKLQEVLSIHKCDYCSGSGVIKPVNCFLCDGTGCYYINVLERLMEVINNESGYFKI